MDGWMDGQTDRRMQAPFHKMSHFFKQEYNDVHNMNNKAQDFVVGL